jgi:hypothetical protein
MLPLATQRGVWGPAMIFVLRALNLNLSFVLLVLIPTLMNNWDLCLPILLWNVRGIGDSDKSPLSVMLYPLCTLSSFAFMNQSYVTLIFPHVLPSFHQMLETSNLTLPMGPQKELSLKLLHCLLHQENLLLNHHPLIISLRWHDNPHECLRLCLPPTLPSFLAELSKLLILVQGSWLLLGDFNPVRSPDEMSSSHINNRLCLAFNSTLNDICVMELPLSGCSFTWSNCHANTTLTRLDRAFSNTQLLPLFPPSP